MNVLPSIFRHQATAAPDIQERGTVICYEYNNGTIYYVNNQRERQGEVTHSERLPGIAFDAVYTLRSAAQ